MRQLLIALALVVAACGGAAGPSPEQTGDATAATTTSTPATSTAGTDTATTPTVASPSDGSSPNTLQADPPREPPEGPTAPDFTLALGQGGDFSLSAEQKPVYMVFWAEW